MGRGDATNPGKAWSQKRIKSQKCQREQQVGEKTLPGCTSGLNPSSFSARADITHVFVWIFGYTWKEHKSARVRHDAFFIETSKHNQPCLLIGKLKGRPIPLKIFGYKSILPKLAQSRVRKDAVG